MARSKHSRSVNAFAEAANDRVAAAERLPRPSRLPLEALWSRQAREADGVDGQQAYGEQLARRRWYVDRVERGELAYTIRDVRRMGRAGSLLVLRHVAAEQGAAVHPLPVVVDEPEAVRTARLCRELNDVTTIATGNLADGHRDLGECERELAEVREARAVLDAREALLIAELAAGRGR